MLSIVSAASWRDTISSWVVCVAFTARPKTPSNPTEPMVRMAIEIITSISEIKKGETIPRHSHHGIETGYVLQGSMVQLPGQAPTLMATGSSILNQRDVPHAGFTVVGDQSLKLLTVHVVDKGKPLYEWVK